MPRTGGSSARTARMSVPRHARVHPRPRLFRRLDRALRGEVVWIGGPPGAGKTVLVASWIGRSRARPIWLQLDAGDADPAALFRALADAAPPAARRRLPRFGPAHVADPAPFARTFARALRAAAGARWVLVLDDWGEVGLDGPADRILRTLLVELAGAVGVVVTSRGEPPAALARLRASGALEVIDGRALAFTRRETAAVVRLWHARALPAATVIERTEGWAAGVALLAANRALLPGSETPQAVFDFLAAEVFARAPRSVQEVLLRVALAPRVAAPAAARLAGERAPEILAELARGGWFVQRHPGPEPSFQLHPLLREFLAARARRSLGDEGYRALALETARVMEGGGDASGAVALFRGAGAADEIARIAIASAPALLEAGAARTLLQWLEALPARALDDPWVLHWRAAARMLVSPEAALPDAERAFARFLREGNALGAYSAWACAVNVILYGSQHDHAAVDRWLDDLPRLRAAFPGWPSPQVEAAVVSAALGGYGLRRPHAPESARWEERAIEIAVAPGDPRLRVEVGTQVLVRALVAANQRRAGMIVDALRPLVADGCGRPLDVITWSLWEAFQRLNAGDAEEALAAASRGLSLAEREGMPRWDASLLSARLLAELALDRLDRATATSAQLARVARDGPRLGKLAHHSAACTLALRRGDPRAALEHGRVAVRLGDEAGAVVPAMIARVGVALALERTGTPALEEALAVARASGVTHCEHGALFLLADTALRRGDERAATAALEQGFAIGERTGSWWIYWLSRAELAELCALALERGVAPGPALAAIRACGLSPGPRARDLPEWPWDTRVEALGGLAIRRRGPAPPDGKAQKKPLELLRHLVLHGERGAPLERLAEALWPDADGDAAHHAVETATYRLRRLLGDPAALVRRSGRLSLDPVRVFVDLWAVESLAARAERLRACGDGTEALRTAARAAALYRGELLPDDDLPPSSDRRAQLRARIERLGGARAPADDPRIAPEADRRSPAGAPGRAPR